MSELQLNLHPNEITPEIILTLKKPTDGFLCPPEANIYDIQFLSFKMRSCKNNFPLLDVEKDSDLIGRPITDEQRNIKYELTQAFFQLEAINTILEFSVGKPIKDFMMIQRHYFQRELLKSYQFSTRFCLPNCRNLMEATYDLPVLSTQVKSKMMEHPYKTESDSFYFVGNQLVMHTKAKYKFVL